VRVASAPRELVEHLPSRHVHGDEVVPLVLARRCDQTDGKRALDPAVWRFDVDERRHRPVGQQLTRLRAAPSSDVFARISTADSNSSQVGSGSRRLAGASSVRPIQPPANGERAIVGVIVHVRFKLP
jgi:hypothetical protein